MLYYAYVIVIIIPGFTIVIVFNTCHNVKLTVTSDNQQVVLTLSVC